MFKIKARRFRKRHSFIQLELAGNLKRSNFETLIVKMACLSVKDIEAIMFLSDFGDERKYILRWPTTVTAKEITSRRKGKPHGKRKRLTAKEITSRQKEKDSRQKEKTHGKKKNLTAKRKRLTAKRKTSRQKEKDSRQKEKPHGKKKKTHGKSKRLTAKRKTSRQIEKPHGK